MLPICSHGAVVAQRVCIAGAMILHIINQSTMVFYVCQHGAMTIHVFNHGAMALHVGNDDSTVANLSTVVGYCMITLLGFSCTVVRGRSALMLYICKDIARIVHVRLRCCTFTVILLVRKHSQSRRTLMTLIFSSVPAQFHLKSLI